MSGQYGYEWPVPSDEDAAAALLGATGDRKRGIPPKTEELLIIFAALYAAGQP